MTVSINLLPWREELKEQQKQQFLILMGAAAGIFLLLVVVIHLIFSNQIESQRANNAYLKKEIAILDAQIREIENLQKEKEKLLARMDIIQQLQTNRPHIVRLFDGITRTVPEGLILSSITRNDKHVVMEGRAESNTRVSKFMRNIEGFAWMEKPLLRVIQAEDEGTGSRAIRFNLEANQVNPNEHEYRTE